MRRFDLTEEQAAEVTRLWWVFVVSGLLSLVAGGIVVAKPSHSLATLAVVAGIFLLADGIVELVGSFGSENENRALGVIAGVLGLVVGIILVRHPFHAAAAIGILFGIWLVAAGGIRLARAMAIGEHLLPRCAIAALEILVGVVIVSEPHIGYATLAILAGLWLILNGIVTIAFGIVIRGERPQPTSVVSPSSAGHRTSAA